MFTGLSFGLFVFLFLWFFKPFGLNEMQTQNHIFIFLGYGIITSTILIVHGILFPKIFTVYFDEKNWTVFKEIIQTLFIIVLIGVGNTLYTDWIGGIRLSVKAFIVFQFFTLAIAILPVTLLIMFKQIRLLKKNLEEAKQISQSLIVDNKSNVTVSSKNVVLIADNEKDRFTGQSDDILYISAADNYMEIVFLENNKPTRKLLRSTLKKAQLQLTQNPDFFRCHRTYLVNLTKVIAVSGNAQGYKLMLENTDEQIPVSRNLNNEIAGRLSFKTGKVK